MHLKFLKYQGIGNDYIIINTVENKIPSDDETKSLLARILCQRHFSIGADGIIFAIPPTTDDYDYRMQIFNPDGSEAEMCGNGIRMFAKYIYSKNIVAKEKLKIETKAGLIKTELIFNGDTIIAVKVDMGIPKLLRSEIPMKGNEGRVINEDLKVCNHVFKITCVNMGNPHCIIFVEDVEKIDITIGNLIEHHELFPKRINVEFVQVLDPHAIKVRVWERGVGETLACGTGASASVVASILNRKIQESSKVYLKGGVLDITWKENGSVFMTGSAEEVYEGEINININ